MLLKKEKEQSTLDEITTLKLQKFISESERITTEAKELNSQLTLNIPISSLTDSKNATIICTIKFDAG